MDSLLIVLLTLLLLLGSWVMKMRQMRDRVALFTRDIDILLNARLRSVLVLIQALKALPQFSNPQVIEALIDVSGYIMRQQKPLNDRLTDEVRLSKLLFAVREGMMQPFEGAVFALRDAVAKNLKEIDEAEQNIRALQGMIHNYVTSYNTMLSRPVLSWLCAKLQMQRLSAVDARL